MHRLDDAAPMEVVFHAPAATFPRVLVVSDLKAQGSLVQQNASYWQELTGLLPPVQMAVREALAEGK